MAATFIEKGSRYCGSRTLFLLILINTAVFAILWLVTVIGNEAGIPGNFTMPWLGVSALPLKALTRAWTLLTYMVTQYSFLHLLFNMLWLLWFGRFLLTTLSDCHLLAVYVGGGLAGAVVFILSSLLITPPGAFLCGASASVLAIMTTAALRTPDLRLMLFLFGEVKLKWVALVCIILTFLGVGGGNSGGQAAHVGGVLFGALFALLLKRGIDPTRHFPRFKRPSLRRRKFKAPDFRRPEEGKTDTERLDELLDKIRVSGYASLSPMERRELNRISQKINN